MITATNQDNDTKTKSAEDAARGVPDGTLLRRYLGARGAESEAAFAEIGKRYARLVYAVCLRELDHPALAEDATQEVFLLLAQKAPALTKSVSLAGWLFTSARLVSSNVRRQEARRQGREEQAMQENRNRVTDAANDAARWREIEPHLNRALARLRPQEREALLIRFFDGASLAITGQRLGIGENAARMRVSRALERTRDLLRQAGVTLSVAALATLLETRAVRAVPPDVLHGIASVAGLPASGVASPAWGAAIKPGVLPGTSSKIGAVAAGVCLAALSSAPVVHRLYFAPQAAAALPAPAQAAASPLPAKPQVQNFAALKGDFTVVYGFDLTIRGSGVAPDRAKIEAQVRDEFRQANVTVYDEDVARAVEQGMRAARQAQEGQGASGTVTVSGRNGTLLYDLQVTKESAYELPSFFAITDGKQTDYRTSGADGSTTKNGLATAPFYCFPLFFARYGDITFIKDITPQGADFKAKSVYPGVPAVNEYVDADLAGSASGLTRVDIKSSKGKSICTWEMSGARTLRGLRIPRRVSEIQRSSQVVEMLPDGTPGIQGRVTRTCEYRLLSINDKALPAGKFARK